MTEMRFDLHAIRYGEVISTDIKTTHYNEDQCVECPHEHLCCDQVVVATPMEAAGILQWLSRNLKDVPASARAIQLRGRIMVEHFKNYPKPSDAIAGWFAKRIKCVFYDTESRRCEIYPVRPAACRGVFGVGDCEGDEKNKGIQTLLPPPEVLSARVERYKIHPEANNNLTELASLVALMMVSREPQYVDQKFFAHDPADLSEEQVIFGLIGAPIKNPVALEN